MGPDTTIGVIAGQTKNLTAIFKGSDTVDISWSTVRPTAAPPGTYEAIATSLNGCKDTAVVDICLKPELGPIQTMRICPGFYANLYSGFNLNGLVAEWDTPTPASAEPGTYKIMVENVCGQRDTGYVTVIRSPKPNIGIDRDARVCRGGFENLEVHFEIGQLTPEWSTSTPESAPVGEYRLVVTNEWGCMDTAYMEVKEILPPPFLGDTTVFICKQQTKDLTSIYPLNPENWLMVWDATDERSASVGTYHLTAEDFNCQHKVTVKVEPFINNFVTLPLCVFTKNEYPLIFSSNRFRSVVVDKEGITWAGNDDGGLYQFVPSGENCGGTWQKSDQFQNNSHNDLHISPVEGDFDIWSASQGYEGTFARAGGVFKILSLDNLIRFGGNYDGSGLAGTLKSRYANSLAISKNGKVYVALGTGTGLTNELRPGGVYQYNTLGSTDEQFTEVEVNLPNTEIVNVHAAGIRQSEVWFGVGKGCNFSGNDCVNPYIVKWNTETNSAAGFIDETNSPLPFDNPSLIVRAIFTDSQDRTWVGFNNGLGMAVYAAPFEGAEPEWFYLTPQNSGLANQSSINSNAIEEVNGEIWFGTNKGLMVYDGISDFTDCRSYVLYTTENGLPSNNITDVAYDPLRIEVWITTDAGIAKMQQPVSVTGSITNVYTGKFPSLLPTINQQPLQNVQLTLEELDGTFIASAITDATGVFELFGGKPNKLYNLKVNYRDVFHYTIQNIQGNKVVGAIPIPDSLIKDIISMMPLLEEECAPIKIIGLDAFEFCFDAFNTNQILSQPARYLGEIKDHFAERVEKLANYYLTLCVAELGANAVVKIDFEMAAAMLEAIETALNTSDAGKKMLERVKIKKVAGSKVLDDLGRATIKDLEAIVNTITTAIGYVKLQAQADGDKDLYDFLKKTESVLGVVLKALVKFKENGLKPGVKVAAQNNLYDFIKSGIATVLTKFIHQIYVSDLQQPIDRSSNLLFATTENLSYEQAFIMLISNEDGLPTSKEAISFKLKEVTKQMGQLKILAKVADIAAKLSEAAELVAKSSGQAQAVVAFKVISTLFKIAQPFTYVASGVLGYYGTKDITDVVIGSFRPTGYEKALNSHNTLSEPDNKLKLDIFSLNKTANLYYHSLEDLKNAFVQNDSIEIENAIERMVTYQGRYNADIGRQVNKLQVSSSELAKQSPAFLSFMAGGIEKYYTKALTHQLALNHLLYAFYLDSLTDGYSGLFQSTVSEIQRLNDSTIGFLSSVSQLAAGFNFVAEPNLVVETVDYNETYGYNEIQTIQITLLNNGDLPITNLKLTAKTQDLLPFNFADSVHQMVELLPNQSKSFAFTFTSPAVDTTLPFVIDIAYNNGLKDSVESYINFSYTAPPGNPISIKSGLWSDPSTWSNGLVPAATSAVTIRHNVTVDIDATCKTLKAESPAQVQVTAGKKLTVLE
ncbi:MAG: hypothetical protein MUF24_01335 [Chitinophagaceae bacterium]|nr:hypothetical protein [Chitinophagaceae bacterium]